jgi:hypothetical protein
MKELLLNELRKMPALMRLGLAVLLAGGALDVLFHAAPASWTPILEIVLGEHGALAHLVTLAGMVVTLIGVFRGNPRALLARRPTSVRQRSAYME